MRPRTQPSPMAKACLFGLFALSGLTLLPIAAQSTGFNQTGAGPFDYNTSGNWVGGTINGIWDPTLALTSAQSVTFGADTTLSTGLNLSYAGNFALTLTGSGAARTLTLGGDISVGTAGNQTIAFGSTTGNQALNVNLGGVVRTFNVSGQGNGGNFGRTLNFINTISNGSLVITGNNTAGGSVRLSSTANTLSAVSIQGAELYLNGGSNNAANTVNTVTGALTATSGNVIVSSLASGSRNTLLQAGSFVRASGATVLFRGANLGVNTIVSATAGANNIAFTIAPSLTGGSGANTTDLGIIAGAYGDNSSSGSGTGLVTYDVTRGVRLLNTATEFKSSITDGQTQLDNVRLAGVSGTPVTNALTTATTVNSLSFDITGAGTNSGATVSGSTTLTLNSGVIFARQVVTTAAATDAQTISVSTLDFNGKEAVVTAISSLSNFVTPGSLTITSALTNATGLTKNGTGELNLTGSAGNTYTGTTTMNGGSIRLARTAGTNTITGNLVANAGTLQWAQSNQVVDSANITINNDAVVQLSDSNFGSTFSETFNNLVMTGGTFRTGGVTAINNATLTGGTVDHRANTLVNTTGALNLSNGATYNVASASGAGSSYNTVLTVNGGLAVTNTTSGAYTPVTIAAGTSATNFGGRINLASDVTFIGNGTNTNTTTISATAGTTRGVIALGGVRTFNVGDGAAANDLTIAASLIDNVSGGLTKTGLGTLALTSVNTYTGATSINEGVLSLGVVNALSVSSPITMGGGTLNTGGFSQTLGTVALTANSIIDLGSGNVALLFAASNGVTWTGSMSLGFINVDANDSIQFGASSGSLTSDQLAQITINGFAAMIDGNGFLTASAVPEPSTCALLAGISLLTCAVVSRKARRG